MTEATIPITEAASAPAATEQVSAPAQTETGGDGAGALSPSVQTPGVEAEPQPSPEKQLGPSPSLLSEGVKAEPAAVPETPAPEETAPAPEPPAPTYEFVIPEGMTFKEEALGEYKTLLSEYKAPPELAQKMLDRHIREINRIQEESQQNQHVVWETTQTEWRDQVKADPELGGNRFETTMANCGTLVRSAALSDAETAEFHQALNFTGAGNNPAIIRVLARVGELLKEGKPAPSAPPAQPQTRAQKRYNASGA